VLEPKEKGPQTPSASGALQRYTLLQTNRSACPQPRTPVGPTGFYLCGAFTFWKPHADSTQGVDKSAAATFATAMTRTRQSSSRASCVAHHFPNVVTVTLSALMRLGCSVQEVPDPTAAATTLEADRVVPGGGVIGEAMMVATASTSPPPPVLERGHQREVVLYVGHLMSPGWIQRLPVILGYAHRSGFRHVMASVNLGNNVTRADLVRALFESSPHFELHSSVVQSEEEEAMNVPPVHRGDALGGAPCCLQLSFVHRSPLQRVT
jgi:hypothetical protein